MKTISKFLIITVITIFAACSSDDDIPQVINEEETITTVKLSVIEDGTTNTQNVSWIQGINGTNNLPTITLEQNKTYNVRIQFLDESNPSDIEDITEEVIEEKDEHYIFYDSTVNGLTISSSTNDIIDTNNIGINIDTNWQISTTSTGGTVRAYLIHEPSQKTGNVRDDFGGETDIEVDFNIAIL